MGTSYSGPSKVLQDVKVNQSQQNVFRCTFSECGRRRTERLRAESNEDFLTGVGNNFRAHAL